MQVLSQVVPLIVSFADPVPEDNDVVAGWVGFAVFILLIVAVALLGRSLVRQLRKVDAAEKAGVYGSSARTTAAGSVADPAESAARQDTEQST